MISKLEKELGIDNDYYEMSKLPIDLPYIENEEKLIISKLSDSSITPREDSHIHSTIVKGIARLKSLNKICKILTNELSLSNEKIENIVHKYQKAVEEGAESDRRLIAMQRELSASKYNTNLNSTSLSNRNYDLESTNILFNRKFSQTVDGKLSNTVVNYNDSRMERSNLISPSKDYKSERVLTECDFSNIGYSPNHNLQRYDTETSQTRIPKYNNMFNSSARYQSAEPSRMPSNYAKYSSNNSKLAGSGYNDPQITNKNEYYNYDSEINQRDSTLKMNNLLRNYSENTLFKSQKANYLNIVKMCNKGEFPQTARYNPPAMPNMMDAIMKNAGTTSGVITPTRSNYKYEAEQPQQNQQPPV